MFFESHAHYDDRQFDNDRDSLLASMKSLGVSYIVNAGADINSSIAGVELSKQYDFIYAAVGVHPHDADSMSAGGLDFIGKLAANDKVVAIGEIGLDFYYDRSKRDIQREWFVKQLELAESLDLPVIIHTREASAETFDIIKKSGVRRGVVHCFSGSPQTALDYVELGFYIGMGGVVTFPKARTAVDVVSAVPIDRLLIETDCPYLAPVPNRGKRNDSGGLIHIAGKIAEIKKITIDEVAGETMRNAMECFAIVR